MAFDRATWDPDPSSTGRGSLSKYVTGDTIATVQASGYFDHVADELVAMGGAATAATSHAIILASCSDGFTIMKALVSSAGVVTAGEKVDSG